MTQVRSSASRARGRALSAALLVGSFALFAGACRNLVAGDGQDASGALCDLLQRCYGKDAIDCTALSARFGKSAQVDDAFLSYLSQNECLASCNDAKKCRDYPPVCGAADAACAETADCCESTLGHRVCQAKRCCEPVGVPCTVDGDCCPGVQCKRVGDTDQRTCSGVVACRELADTCGNDIDCCSKSCEGGVCRQKTCSSVGEKCSDAKGGATCCQGSDPNAPAITCQSGVCVAQACHASTCGDLAPCDPHGDPATACCGAPTLRCVANVLGDYGVCVSADGSSTVLPDGFDCAYDTDCCSGSCIATGVGYQCGTQVVGCVGQDQACTVDPTTGLGNCCFGDCVDGHCACAGATCHSSYEEGAPIHCQPGESGGSPNCDAAQICAVDPFCCCNQWDAICVGEAFTTCGPPTAL